jgi:tetratricopeptide (TPR) repeat protein/DNA-binding CsgD family transcriptional regulator
MELHPHFMLAEEFARNGNFTRAIDLYEEIRREATTDGERYDLCRADLALGYLKGRRGLLAEAIDHLGECLRIVGSFGAGNLAGCAWLVVGTLHMHVDDPQGAIGSFERAIEEFRNSDDIAHEAEARLMVAQAQSSLGALPFTSMFQALILFEELDAEERMAEILSEIGSLYQRAGDYSLALEYQQMALERARQARSRPLTSLALLHLGDLYRHDGSLQQAIDALMEGIQLVERSEEIELSCQLHELAAIVYEEAEMQEKALEHYRAFSALRDEKLRRRREQGVIDFRAALEREQALAERERVEREVRELRDKLTEKSREATELGLQLMQKSELLSDVKQGLKGLVETAQSRVKTITNSLMERLTAQENSDDSWQMFEQQFDEANREFMRRLVQLFPSLTPMEIKICTLTKLDLPTKDIAQLLFVSVRNVENHRYRLRKKLGLSSRQNLTAFLLEL